MSETKPPRLQLALDPGLESHPRFGKEEDDLIVRDGEGVRARCCRAALPQNKPRPIPENVSSVSS